MSFMKAIMGVVKTAAPIAANLVLPGTGSIVGGLLDEVVPGPGTQEEKAEKVINDPKLLAELKAKAIDLEAALAQEKTKNMALVADTMKSELTSGKWYQRAWRPWNGFLFPIAVLLVYVVLPLCNAILPSLNMIQVPEVPEFLWVTWGAVLGVATYGRNQEKQAQVPGAGGLLNTVSKMFKKG